MICETGSQLVIRLELQKPACILHSLKTELYIL